LYHATDNFHIPGLQGYQASGERIEMVYFYPDGRRAAICFQEWRGPQVICTKTNYHNDIVLEYRFRLDNRNMLPLIDRRLSEIFGLR